MRRLVLAFALLAGCGDDSGGGDIPIDGLENAVISTYCNLYVTCGLIDDATTCRSIYTDIEIDPSLVAAVKAGKVIYHPDKARECLSGISGCDRNLFARGDNSDACDTTFEGTVAGGGQCAMDEECISQQCDVPSCPDACCQGTCFGDTPPTHPRVGEACGGATSTSCSNSYCDFTTMVCTAYRANGEACTSTSQCATGGCTNSVCTAYPGPGEPCSNMSASTLCADLGYTCSVTTSTCVAYGLTGDACMAARDCSPLYGCNASSTCQLRPRLGESCSDAQSTGDCIDHSYCEPTTMMCTAPKSDNAACVSDQECASNNCDADMSICTTPPICI